MLSFFAEPVGLSSDDGTDAVAENPNQSSNVVEYDEFMDTEHLIDDQESTSNDATSNSDTQSANSQDRSSDSMIEDEPFFEEFLEAGENGFQQRRERLFHNMFGRFDFRGDESIYENSAVRNGQVLTLVLAIPCETWS